MKRSVIFYSLCLIFSASAHAQLRELDASRGHYKQLAEIDPGGRQGTEIDHEKFPKNPASIEKLKTYNLVYLENIKADEFRIPDPPANSSEQTRAELNYLLQLQNQRTR